MMQLLFRDIGLYHSSSGRGGIDPHVTSVWVLGENKVRVEVSLAQECKQANITVYAMPPGTLKWDSLLHFHDYNATRTEPANYQDFPESYYLGCEDWAIKRAIMLIDGP